MSRGRPQRPYKPSWGGDPIVGLYKCPDGRWRVNATGAKFSEPDEARAIQRFYAMTGALKPIDLPLATLPLDAADEVAMVTVDGPDAMGATRNGVAMLRKGEGQPTPSSGWTASRPLGVPEAVLWAYVREQFDTNIHHVAKMLGAPELVNWKQWATPETPIKLADLIEVYKRENPATDKSKREAVSVFQRLIDHAQATTLDDLTQEKLLAFRETIESSGKLQSAGTRQGYYGRIKTIISFGLKVGLDQAQIRAALDRCRVLWTAEPLPAVDPKPISKAHFHKLLETAGTTPWRAWLLLGLNLCAYLEDLCELRWADLDLEKGTYATIRVKTRRERIPRAAVLWAETIEAMKTIPRKGPYVFTSTHGTRYNRNTRVNDFKELREKAKLPDDVTFSTLRDGSYSAACQGTTDERWARVLAGHKAPGLQDNYVLRNPEKARPACEAVYAAYGPFPTSAR